MTTGKRHAGVQELLPLEDIVDDVVCLRGGDYRAVLEAQSINFALKSERWAGARLGPRPPDVHPG
jgi:hypothetical protein